MPVACVPETSIAVESRGGAAAGAELDAFPGRAGIEPGPVTRKQPEAAREAWRRLRSDPAASARPSLPANVVPPERIPARQCPAGVPGAGTRGGAWILRREVRSLALMGGAAPDSREAGFGP